MSISDLFRRILRLGKREQFTWTPVDPATRSPLLWDGRLNGLAPTPTPADYNIPAFEELLLEEAAAILDADPELVQCALNKGSLQSLQLADVRRFRDDQAQTWDDLAAELSELDDATQAPAFATLH